MQGSVLQLGEEGGILLVQEQGIQQGLPGRRMNTTCAEGGSIGDKRDWFQVVDRALLYNISSTI